MKKTLITLSLLFIFISIQAQTDKGNWLINGSVDYGLSGGLSQINLQPTAGYFIKDNLVVGGSLPIQYSSTSVASSSLIGFGPFMRYYFLDGKVKPFAYAQAQFFWYNLDVPPNPFFGDLSESESFQQFDFGIGVNYFLSDYFALEARLNYNANNRDTFREFEGNELGLQFGFNFFISKENEKNEDFLLDRYLKKGNHVWGIAGFFDFEPQLLGLIDWNIFLKDRLALNNNLNLFFIAETGDLDFFFINQYNLTVQPYLALSKNLFFSPKFGPSIAIGGGSGDLEGAFSVLITPQLSLFLKNSLLDLSLDIVSPGIITSGDSFGVWSGNLSIGYEQFVYKNLSVKARFTKNFFGSIEEVFLIDDEFVSENQFEIGIGYFIEGKTKD